MPTSTYFYRTLLAAVLAAFAPIEGSNPNFKTLRDIKGNEDTTAAMLKEIDVRLGGGPDYARRCKEREREVAETIKERGKKDPEINKLRIEQQELLRQIHSNLPCDDKVGIIGKKLKAVNKALRAKEAEIAKKVHCEIPPVKKGGLIGRAEEREELLKQVTQQSEENRELLKGVIQQSKELLQQSKQVTEEGEELLQQSKKITEEGAKLLQQSKKITEEGEELLQQSKQITEEGAELLQESARQIKKNKLLLQQREKRAAAAAKREAGMYEYQLARIQQREDELNRRIAVYQLNNQPATDNNSIWAACWQSAPTAVKKVGGVVGGVVAFVAGSRLYQWAFGGKKPASSNSRRFIQNATT